LKKCPKKPAYTSNSADGTSKKRRISATITINRTKIQVLKTKALVLNINFTTKDTKGHEEETCAGKPRTNLQTILKSSVAFARSADKPLRGENKSVNGYSIGNAVCNFLEVVYGQTQKTCSVKC
jgi:hypothetical protein